MSNAGNIRRFEADLEGFAKKLNVAINTVVIKIALDLHRKISKRTPVDTGRARASWDVKEGGPSEFLPPPGNYTGPKPVGSEGLKGEDVIFVTSAVEYMEFLEAGSSKQAPGGMIDISIAEMQVELASIVAKIRNS